MAATVISHSCMVEYSNYIIMANERATTFNLAVMKDQGMEYQVCL